MMFLRVIQDGPGSKRRGERAFYFRSSAVWGAFLIIALSFSSALAGAEDTDPVIKANQQKARQVLDAMVLALGGNAWLAMDNREYEGRQSGFYQGRPTGAIVDYYAFHRFPDQDRTEFTKKRDVVQILSGQEGWEITYRGKRALPAEQLDNALRRRDHSVEVAIKTWLKDPQTILFYDGQRTIQRHLAEQVRIVSSANDTITIETDAESHLPVRRSFEWRDALYKDKNESAEEYDDYHAVSGIQTPFTITSYLNGEMNDQKFLRRASYNLNLPPETFSADMTAARIKK